MNISAPIIAALQFAVSISFLLSYIKTKKLRFLIMGLLALGLGVWELL